MLPIDFTPPPTPPHVHVVQHEAQTQAPQATLPFHSEQFLSVRPVTKTGSQPLDLILNPIFRLGTTLIAPKHYANPERFPNARTGFNQGFLDTNLFKPEGQTPILPNTPAFRDWASATVTDAQGAPLKLPEMTPFQSIYPPESPHYVEGLEVSTNFDVDRFSEEKPIAVVMAGASRLPFGTDKDPSTRDEIAMLNALGFKIMAVNLPGFGPEHPGYANDESFALSAEALTTLLNEKKLAEKAVLFGFSTSNNVVLRMLAHPANRVKLAFCAGAFDEFGHSFNSFMQNAEGVHRRSPIDKLAAKYALSPLFSQSHSFNNVHLMRRIALNKDVNPTIHLFNVVDDYVTTPPMADTLTQAAEHYKVNVINEPELDWQKDKALRWLYAEYLFHFSTIHESEFQRVEKGEVTEASPLTSMKTVQEVYQYLEDDKPQEKPHLFTPTAMVYQHHAEIARAVAENLGLPFSPPAAPFGFVTPPA